MYRTTRLIYIYRTGVLIIQLIDVRIQIAQNTLEPCFYTSLSILASDDGLAQAIISASRDVGRNLKQKGSTSNSTYT